MGNKDERSIKASLERFTISMPPIFTSFCFVDFFLLFYGHIVLEIAVIFTLW